ncbi:MAG: hypothetical protein U1C74_17735, partial [Phenylobacterium sp.]|nr:hypothetical protein [Phenylobacterium sp.]
HGQDGDGEENGGENLHRFAPKRKIIARNGDEGAIRVLCNSSMRVQPPIQDGRIKSSSWLRL